MNHRFHFLDVLRAVAALAVVSYHCLPVAASGPVANVLSQGWMGVFVFFPISGYCICSAIHGQHTYTISEFLTRRWRRIYPPYLWSIALAIALGLAVLPFSNGSIISFEMPVAGWISIITLTQVFTSYSTRINPVYWSLCYEEQFYLIMACSLLITSARTRAAFFTVLTGAAIACNAAGWTMQGLFLGYWIPFAAGVAVYYLLSGRGYRTSGVAILGLSAVSAMALHEPGTYVSLITCVVMLAAAPLEAHLQTQRWLKPLYWIGMISYSVYLIHVPIGGRIVNALSRVDAPSWLAMTSAIIISVAAGFGFFALIESKWLRKPTQGASAVKIGEPVLQSA